MGSLLLLPLHPDTWQLDSHPFHTGHCLLNTRDVREYESSGQGAGALQSEESSGGQHKSSRRLQTPAYLIN